MRKQELVSFAMSVAMQTAALVRIGFGGAGGMDDPHTYGNLAYWTPDNGDKNIKAMGYIFIQ